MKTRLIMLIAVVSMVFTVFTSFTSAPAQAPCPGYVVQNDLNCPFTFDLDWDCGGTIVTTSGTVGANSTITVPNPSAAGCCRVVKIRIKDYAGNVHSLDMFTPVYQATIVDCTGALVTAEIVFGPNGPYLWIH